MVAVVLVVLCALVGCGSAQNDHVREVGRETLLAHWKDYQGREVVVSGLVVFGEGAIMYLPRRPDLPISDQADGIEAMFVVPSTTMQERPGKLDLDYLRYQRDSVVARMRGRFTGADIRRFGHQNCCRFRLEVSKVLSLRAAGPVDR